MAQVKVDQRAIARFCRKNHIGKLSFFGSVLRPDFGPDSDIDVLVEFEEGHVPGLITLARMARDLSSLMGGRPVDLRTPEDLSLYFREHVVEGAEVHYVQ